MVYVTNEITKVILIQYIDMKNELVEVNGQITKLEKEIDKIESEGSVIDCVKGGEGGIQNFKISGFPYPSYSRKKTLLYARKENYKCLMDDLDMMIKLVEEYINGIDDSRIRRILRYKYIDKLTWIQIAHKIGGRSTADSIRMEHNNFLKNLK